MTVRLFILINVMKTVWVRVDKGYLVPCFTFLSVQSSVEFYTLLSLLIENSFGSVFIYNRPSLKLTTIPFACLVFVV